MIPRETSSGFSRSRLQKKADWKSECVVLLELIPSFGSLRRERIDQGFLCPIQPGLHILEPNRGGHNRTARIRGQDNGDVKYLVPTAANMVL
jgi:hypothetical protein